MDRLREEQRLDTEGIWYDWEEGGESARVLLAALWNANWHVEYQRLLLQAVTNGTEGIETGSPEDLALQRKATARTVVLGWEGILDVDEDGSEFEVEYSPERAEEYLQISKLQTFVQRNAGLQRTKQKEHSDAAGKQLAAT